MLIGFLSGLSVSVLPKGVRRFIVYLLLSRSFEVAARIVKTKLIEKRRGSFSFIGAAATPVTAADDDAILCDQEANPLPVNEDIFTSHEVVGLASVSMTIIIAAWFRFASLELIPKSYLSFLHGINNLTAKQVSDVSRVIANEYTDADTELKKLACGRLCRGIHPAEQLCPDFFVNFVLKGIVTRTGPFYLKLYALPLAVSIFKRKGNVSRLMIIHYLTRAWWSSLFLATMNATVATTVCFLSKFANSFVSQQYQAILGGTASGLSLYIEQDGRRLELALYLFGQAIQILVNAYTHFGLWAPTGMDIITSAASISVMTYAFWEREEKGRLALIRPGYASLFSKIVDTKDTRHGFRI